MVGWQRLAWKIGEEPGIMRVDKVRQSEVSSGEVLSDERFKIKLIPKGPKVWKYLRVTTKDTHTPVL